MDDNILPQQVNIEIETRGKKKKKLGWWGWFPGCCQRVGWDIWVLDDRQGCCEVLIQDMLGPRRAQS